MIVFFGALIVLLIGGIFVVAAGHGESLPPSHLDLPDQTIPTDRPVTAADLREIRFSTVMRGYRAAEVDALLDRLAGEMEQR